MNCLLGLYAIDFIYDVLLYLKYDDTLFDELWASTKEPKEILSKELYFFI